MSWLLLIPVGIGVGARRRFLSFSMLNNQYWTLKFSLVHGSSRIWEEYSCATQY